MTKPDGRHGSNVVFDLDYIDGVFEFVLVNIGDELALSPRVRFSRQLTGLGGRTVVTELPIWERLTLLRPDGEVRVFFDTSHNILREPQKTFTAHVTWKSMNGDEFRAKYTHDMEAYRGLPQMTRD